MWLYSKSAKYIHLYFFAIKLMQVFDFNSVMLYYIRRVLLGMVKRSGTGNSASGRGVNCVLAARDRRLKTSQGSDKRLGTTGLQY